MGFSGAHDYGISDSDMDNRCPSIDRNSPKRLGLDEWNSLRIFGEIRKAW